MTRHRELVVDTRPTPGVPRPYDFPDFERIRLANGLTLITAHLPGRPLISASLIMVNGAVDEPPEWAGATILAARALSEGTERYDAIELVEAAERLGASLHAEASWDATSAGVEVPAARLETGARAPGRARPPPHVSGLRGRAPPRRAPQRPAPGAGRPAPSGRGGLRRDDLYDRLALSPPGRGPAGNRGAPGPGRPSGRLPARPRPGPIDVPRGRGRCRHRRDRDRRATLRDVAGGRRGDLERPHCRPVRGRRTPDPADPSAGLGPDRDPDRPRRRRPAGSRLPRPVGHGRDPGRPLQLAAEHEAARGEGLHLRRERRLGAAPWPGTVRRPGRRQRRGHHAGRPGHPRRAGADPRGAGHGGRAQGGARLPGRRLPDPLRDARARSWVPWPDWRSTACRTTSSRGTANGSRRSRSTTSWPRPGPTSISSALRSSWSATPMRSRASSPRPDFGVIDVEREPEGARADRRSRSRSSSGRSMPRSRSPFRSSTIRSGSRPRNLTTAARPDDPCRVASGRRSPPQSSRTRPAGDPWPCRMGPCGACPRWPRLRTAGSCSERFSATSGRGCRPPPRAGSCSA